MPENSEAGSRLDNGVQRFLAILLSRQSISAKRLIAPGPRHDELHTMVAVVVTAPDHRGLRPWRFILIAGEARNTLAELFLSAKARAAPDAGPEELQRERERAMRAPTLLAVVARLQRHDPRVDERDQYASAGAAIQNVLLTAHAMGYGAIMLSGRKTRDPELVSGLGLSGQEELMGFICLGTPVAALSHKNRPKVGEHLTIWNGLPDCLDRKSRKSTSVQ
jgi:nitroreductase